MYTYVYSAPVPSEGSSKQGMNGPAKGEIALSLPPSLFSLIFLFVFYFYKYIYIYIFLFYSLLYLYPPHFIYCICTFLYICSRFPWQSLLF